MKILSSNTCCNFVQRSFLLFSCLTFLAIPALAGVTVNSPGNNSEVGSPFTLSATSASCSSQNVSAMGYSFDSSADTTVVNSSTIDASVGSATGAHTLHVKSWGNKGASCVTDIAINVTAGTSTESGDSLIPSNATTVSSIQAMSNWASAHDTGGVGSSSGSTTIVSSPSLHGSTRRFVTNFSNSGDERYSVAFSDDVNAENLFYDAWVYLTSSASNIGNIEMDVNQVMANGQTVLIGVQCDGYSGTWAYTVNNGSASHPAPHWDSKSGTTCNPRNWTRNQWHHVQASFSRNSSGTITYHSVWFDGTEVKLNATAFGAADLGWGPVINTQFQVDGLGSGSATVYLDSLSVSRW
jgi:hypothetical protein